MATTVFLRDLLLNAQTIYPMAETVMPAALAYSNEADFDPTWAAHLATVAYKKRLMVSEEVRIGLLPDSVTLTGGYHFLLRSGTAVIAESIPHALRDDPAALEAALTEDRPVIDMDEECVLLARYGHGTWGHWAAEVLPIAAAVEARLPGRFRYAVPQVGHIDFVTGMIQSLACYGIDIHRLTWLRHGNDYRLRNARAVTPIWSDLGPHPSALATLRNNAPRHEAPARQPRETGGKMALLRRDRPTRGIGNADEVAHVLVGQGFHVTDMAGMRFSEQVRNFQSAEVVFAVLGSGLTGLVYAPDNVRVIAASPSGFSDRFFYALAQSRNGRWADVKGRSLWDGTTGMLRDAPFEIPMAALRAALAALHADCGQP
jgi:hypothetical protein